MKSFLVIGASKFGKHLSKNLADLGSEVMLVDKDENKIHDLLSTVTNVQIGDCTQLDVLKSLGPGNFDVCFVCMATNFQSSLEITSLLAENGAKFVVSKASSDIHKKFLLSNGANEVVYPEKDISAKVAMRFSTNSVLDYTEIADNIAIVELGARAEWIGKTIRNLEFRAKYHLNILAIKDGAGNSTIPSPDYLIKANDHVLAMGEKETMAKELKIITK